MFLKSPRPRYQKLLEAGKVQGQGFEKNAHKTPDLHNLLNSDPQILRRYLPSNGSAGFPGVPGCLCHNGNKVNFPGRSKKAAAPASQIRTAYVLVSLYSLIAYNPLKIKSGSANILHLRC